MEEESSGSSRKNPLIKTIHEYAEAATIHGMFLKQINFQNICTYAHVAFSFGAKMITYQIDLFLHFVSLAVYFPVTTL